MTRDIGYSVMYCRKERHSPADYLRPYFRPHVFAIFDLKDPRPFVRRCLHLAKTAFQKVIHAVGWLGRVVRGAGK
jgi:hypothetical protein